MQKKCWEDEDCNSVFWITIKRLYDLKMNFKVVFLIWCKGVRYCIFSWRSVVLACKWSSKASWWRLHHSDLKKVWILSILMMKSMRFSVKMCVEVWLLVSILDNKMRKDKDIKWRSWILYVDRCFDDDDLIGRFLIGEFWAEKIVCLGIKNLMILGWNKDVWDKVDPIWNNMSNCDGTLTEIWLIRTISDDSLDRSNGVDKLLDLLCIF